MTGLRAQGWYRDPFGAHEARWFSQGRPTSLVRDADLEAQDGPPADVYIGPLQELDDDAAENGEDLLRADDPASAPFSGKRAANAAMDAVASAGPGFS